MNATSQEHRTGALEEYARLKLELAAIVRAILHVAERHKHDQAIRETRRLLARLAEDRFNLAVLGVVSVSVRKKRRWPISGRNTPGSGGLKCARSEGGERFPIC